MSDEVFSLRPIGRVHSPWTQGTGTPVQPPSALGITGTVDIFPEFIPGLADLAGFERIWLLFWCHRAKAAAMRVLPYRDTQMRGLFATRAPARPNPIGMSAVRLLGIDGGIITVGELDLLDGTPLIDVKPYVADYDAYPQARRGWLEDATVTDGPMRADHRFER